MSWICKIIGHKVISTEPERGIAGTVECVRCDYTRPGITWPKPPPMPAVKPAQNKAQNVELTCRQQPAQED